MVIDIKNKEKSYLSDEKDEGEPTLLIVDDEEFVCKSLKDMLENEGYSPDATQSPEKALEMISGNKYDIVLTDIKMDEINGIDLIKNVKEKEKMIKFIVITGYPSMDTAVEALRLGANDYIMKPLEPEEVIKSIENSWENIRLQRALKRSEEKYRSIFENLNIPLIVVNEELEIKKANSGFERLSGHDKRRIENKMKKTDFFSKEDEVRIKSFHDIKNLKENAMPDEQIVKFIDRNDNEKEVVLFYNKLPDSDNWIVSLMDVTEMSDIISDIQKLQRDIINSENKTLDEMFGSLIERGPLENESYKESIRNWALEELLLLIIAHRDGASGKQVMSDLNNYFGIDVSTSVVYPKLKELHKEGILELKENIRTKKYYIEEIDEINPVIDEKVKRLFMTAQLLKHIFENT